MSSNLYPGFPGNENPFTTDELLHIADVMNEYCESYDKDLKMLGSIFTEVERTPDKEISLWVGRLSGWDLEFIKMALHNLSDTERRFNGNAGMDWDSLPMDKVIDKERLERALGHQLGLEEQVHNCYVEVQSIVARKLKGELPDYRFWEDDFMRIKRALEWWEEKGGINPLGLLKKVTNLYEVDRKWRQQEEEYKAMIEESKRLAQNPEAFDEEGV